MAERRDRAHGHLSNIVLRDFGNVVKTEKLSKTAWKCSSCTAGRPANACALTLNPP